MAFATDPIGRADVASRAATIPFRLVASAKLPWAGTGIAGGVAPSTSNVAGTWTLTVGAGGCAVSRTVTIAAAVISTTPITAVNTIHTHDVRRVPAIRLVYALPPVACVGDYSGRRHGSDASRGIRPWPGVNREHP